MRKNIGFKISLILVIILLATALLAPVLAPNDPNVTNIMLSEAKPSADYPPVSYTHLDVYKRQRVSCQK